MGPHSRFLRFDCVRRTGPRCDRACRRARSRQGRCTPLKRWPEDGPSLTAAVRDRTDRAQVGTEGWCRSNKRMGRALLSRWWTSRFRFRRVVEHAGSGSGSWPSVQLIWRRSGGGKTIAVVGFDEAASGGHGGQPLIEAGGADAASPTQFGECKRTGGLGECGGGGPGAKTLPRGFRVAPVRCPPPPRLCAVGGVGPNTGHCRG